MVGERFEMPMEMYGPTMPRYPRDEYQMHWRRGILHLVYQFCFFEAFSHSNELCHGWCFVIATVRMM
jgi:hypothetical protein